MLTSLGFQHQNSLSDDNVTKDGYSSITAHWSSTKPELPDSLKDLSALIVFGEREYNLNDIRYDCGFGCRIGQPPIPAWNLTIQWVSDEEQFTVCGDSGSLFCQTRSITKAILVYCGSGAEEYVTR